MTEGGGSDFSSVVVLSQGIRLAMGVFGALAAFGLLRALNWINGTKFTDHMQIIDDTPLSLALYLGIRFFSVLLFVALLLQ